MGVRWSLIVLLSCASLMTNDPESLCVFIAHLGVSCRENACSNMGPIFKMGLFGLFGFLISIVRTLLDLDTSPYQIHDLQIFFSVLWVVI